MKEAVLYEKLENNKVRCLACRHKCIIKDGMTGICGVRVNKGGKLYLIAHSHPSAVHLDPIEKKPFYHFLPSTYAFSLGTQGCNFRCSWCQNHDLSQSIKERAKFNAEIAINIIRKESHFLPPEDVVKLAKQYDASTIAYTYNEPTIWSEYAKDIAVLARKEGLKNVFVSSGYESDEAIEYLKEIDAFNIDLKAFNDKTYREHIGGELDGVLQTIKKIKRKKKWIEITTLVIPKINDSEEEIREIARFIASLDNEIPWHISRFYPHYKMTHLPPTPIETLHKAMEIGKEEGLKHVYIGNVIDEDRESTYCPKCGRKVIIRRGYSVQNKLKDGKCPYCGYKIKGVWK